MSPLVTGLFTLAAALIGAATVIWNVNRTIESQHKLERDRWEREDRWRRVQLKSAAYSSYLEAVADAQMALSFAFSKQPTSPEKLKEVAQRLSARSAAVTPLASRDTLAAVNEIALAFGKELRAAHGKETPGLTVFPEARGHLLTAVRADLGTDLPDLDRAVDETARRLAPNGITR